MKQSLLSRIFNLLLILLRRPIRSRGQFDALRARLARMDARDANKAERLCRIDEVAQSHCQSGVLEPLDFSGDRSAARYVLFFHGGAYCLHSPNRYRLMLAGICQRLGAIGVLPDYRLAPEHPHPAAIDDCYESYVMLLEKGVDASRIALLGDSAGGGLVLSVLARIRAAGLAMPSSASLFSPAGDWTLSAPSFYENEGRDPMFRVSSFLFFRSLYLGTTEATDLDASPLRQAFEGYPPLYFTTSSTELMRDIAVIGADKARAAGVPVELDIWPGQCHDLQLMSMLPEAREAMERFYGFINRYW
ncbi:MAG: alpha/beta hydrolase [Spongiibacter sp.]|nr:alpha/beta hydrolase [Spongiibacter sp.]